MIKLLEIYSQRDKRWRDKKLGFSNVSIGGFGCLITVLAMIARYYKKDTDPDKMNEDLKKVNGFTGGYYKWKSLTKIYPDIKYTRFVKTPDPLRDGQFKEIDNHLAKGHLVMFEVDFNPNTACVEGHFVLALSKSENTYRIIDPWTGRKCSLKKFGVAKYTIQRYVLYEGTKPSEGVVPNNESNDCFRECFITQAQRWPNEKEIKEWKKSNNPVYTFVQNNAPNPIKEELVRTKDEVRTLNETVKELRSKQVSNKSKWDKIEKGLVRDVSRLEGKLGDAEMTIELKDENIDELVERMASSVLDWNNERTSLENTIEEQGKLINEGALLTASSGWRLILEGCRKLLGGDKR